MASECVQVVRFVRLLRGASQPILVEGMNGIFYVLKFRNNPQGCNVLFNDAAGIQLYRACHLPTPLWEPLHVSNGFLERNRACWIEGPKGPIKPESGLCFGARFLSNQSSRLFEILPGTRYDGIHDRWIFWLSWIIDACCSHTDHRQALFLKQGDNSFEAVFIDSGNLFGGPNGNEEPRPLASRYLDPRIYPELTHTQAERIAKTIGALRPECLFSRIQRLPTEWQTSNTLASFSRGLGRLSDRSYIEHFLAQLVMREKSSSRHKRRTLTAELRV